VDIFKKRNACFIQELISDCIRKVGAKSRKVAGSIIKNIIEFFLNLSYQKVFRRSKAWSARMAENLTDICEQIL
jgi:hypothetical protein